jgi:hypothetical protein
MAAYNRSIIAATLAGLMIYCAGCLSAANAQSTELAAEKAPAASDNKNPSNSADNLAVEGQRIADKYKHLEQVMLQMAELSAQTDPRRAALLKKAIAQSKEQLIEVRINNLIELLGKDQLSQALDNQADLDRELRSLLDLLLSENRAKRIQSEKARIREYLKRLGNLLKQEKDLQSRTTSRDDAKRLAGEQGGISEKTGGLAQDIQTNEEGGVQKKQSGKQKSEGGGKKAEGENSGGEGQEEAQDQQQGDEQGNPARKSLEAARKRMDDAKNKLEKAQRDGAAKDQEEAVKELEQAKAALEQILRQLREEEVMRVLAMLEGRFRKMLEMQREVYDKTVGLDKIPAAERTHNHEIESSRLSGKEMQIIVEIDKALLLLREDGTTVALAEAAGQTRADMQQVVDRLSQAKVGQVTQGVELDITASLEEIVDALKKAQKDMEKNRSKPGPQGAQQDAPLVDKLAELKMIRALQMRINIRTQRYSKLIQGEQAENAELVDALKRLAERQERVYRVTHDLSSGKTE